MAEKTSKKSEIPRIEEVVTIEKIISGGYGLSRLSDQRIIMVKNTLVGEKISVSYKPTKKDFSFGRVVDYLETSPLRIIPPCPLFGSCGGCQFQMVDYKNQLLIKQDIIRESISRIGKLDIPVNPIIESEKPYHYRNKGSFQVFNGGEIGFCKPGTTFPFKVDYCYLMEDAINHKMNDFALEENLKSSIQRFKALTIRSNFEEKTIDSSKKGDFFYEEVLGLRFLVDVDTFFQVNRNILPLWLNTIKNLVARHTKGIGLLDLFCGVGIIGQFLSPLFKEVLGLEINKKLIENGNKVILENNLSNVKLIEANASLFYNYDFVYDTIIVNPPRTGLPESMIETLIQQKPPVIIYSSCNPDTFARDLNALIYKGNYQVDELQPFDMFPQTQHCEIVTVLYQK